MRKKCVERRESDPDPNRGSYYYTDLLDLRDILEKRWAFIQNHLSRLGSDRPSALRDLERLNEIRNAVMHPVRGVAPDEEAFAFLSGFKEGMGIGS